MTPVGDMDGTLRMPQAECPVVAPPAMPALVNRPAQTLSSVGPKCVSPIESSRFPMSINVSPALRSPPLVTVHEDFMLFHAAVTTQTQPESSPSWMGSVEGGQLLATLLTPSQATASRPATGLGVVGESSEVMDRVTEGLFDIHQDGSRSLPSPRILQDNQGCLFRMTSYDVQSDGPNFAPEHGVQLHDPRLLEYVGAPESARQTSRSP